MYKRFLLLIACLLLLPFPVKAIESTAYTYTLSTDYKYIRTQDAYLPGSVMLRELSMRSPEDIFIHDGNMYIADTGNSRIVKYHMTTGRVDFLGEAYLSQPMGVCVSDNGTVYIADYGKCEIIILTATGDLLDTIPRPQNQIYGASTSYKPQKVALDSFGNLYVTSEGTHEGILQFDLNGNFAGFFGANQTRSLTFMEWIQDSFFTREQKEKLFFRNPDRIVNVDVARDNLVYSVTQLNWRNALKKLNMAGINILRRSQIDGDNYFVDVAIGKGGEMFAVTDKGAITEYDNDGRYLFAFGGRAISADRNGLTAVASGIAIDDQYHIYVLDKQRGIVQPYAPTPFAMSIHEGLEHYRQGRYAKAANIWQEFIRLTPRASFPHWGYGLALWQMGDYQNAKYELELVGDLEYASDALWEIRNDWLMKNLGTLLICLVAIYIMFVILKQLRKRRDFMAPIAAGWRKVKRKSPLVANTVLMKKMVVHPIDTLYDLKHGLSGSVLNASLLYAMALGVWLIDTAFTARLFSTMAFGYAWRNPIVITSMVVIPGILFVIGNYLISSINDGEGSFKNVYIAIAYAFSFYIMATPLITVISHVLTLNEGFVHTLLKLAVLGYTFVLVFIAAKETHNYTFFGTVKNLLLTLCFIVLAIVAVAILYMMWNELIGFIATLIEEVRYRV